MVGNEDQLRRLRDLLREADRLEALWFALPENVRSANPEMEDWFKHSPRPRQRQQIATEVGSTIDRFVEQAMDAGLTREQARKHIRSLIEEADAEGIRDRPPPLPLETSKPPDVRRPVGPKSTGNRQERCFELAFQAFMAMETPGEWRLVHGELSGETVRNGRVSHAWLTNGQEVFDPVQEKFFTEAEWQSRYNAVALAIFDELQCAETAIKAGHYGPWTE